MGSGAKSSPSKQTVVAGAEIPADARMSRGKTKEFLDQQIEQQRQRSHHSRKANKIGHSLSSVTLFGIVIFSRCLLIK